MDKLTKIPIIWLFATTVTVASCVLFLADIRGQARVNSVKTEVLEKEVMTMQTEIRESLKDIRKKIDNLNVLCRRRDK